MFSCCRTALGTFYRKIASIDVPCMCAISQVTRLSRDRTYSIHASVAWCHRETKLANYCPFWRMANQVKLLQLIIRARRPIIEPARSALCSCVKREGHHSSSVSTADATSWRRLPPQVSTKKKKSRVQVQLMCSTHAN